MKSTLLAALLSIFLAATFCQAQNATGNSQRITPKDPTPATQGAGQAQSAAQKYFTDVELINQNGEKMRLYSDLMKGKVVIISSFLATCTSACPLKHRNLEKIQDWLGDRLGKQVYMFSITVDPLTDTSVKLKEYAKLFHAKPGWYFLSGKKENVDWALYKLGQYVENKDDHLNIIVIGNETTGLWKKAFGLAKSDELIKVVDSVVNDKVKDSN